MLVRVSGGMAVWFAEKGKRPGNAFFEKTKRIPCAASSSSRLEFEKAKESSLKELPGLKRRLICAVGLLLFWLFIDYFLCYNNIEPKGKKAGFRPFHEAVLF